jgi:ligand-binding sensor domain-containing protein
MATAFPPKQSLPGIWHTYDSSKGLTIAASRLLQDQDGHLWIAAHPPGGLCRYDGIELTYFTHNDRLPGYAIKLLYFVFGAW